MGRVAVLKGIAQCQKVTFRSGLELMGLIWDIVGSIKEQNGMR